MNDNIAMNCSCIVVTLLIVITTCVFVLYQGKWTALMIAADKGRKDIALYLARKGADLRIKNNVSTCLVHFDDAYGTVHIAIYKCRIIMCTMRLDLCVYLCHIHVLCPMKSSVCVCMNECIHGGVLYVYGYEPMFV